jgi:hypothetical protein
MSKTSETGHATNVANFKKMVTNVTSLAEAYNPSKESIKLENLKAQYQVASKSIDAVTDALTATKTAIKAREAAFKPLGKLATKVSNSLKVSDAPSNVNETADSILNKLQGRKVSGKHSDEEMAAAEAEGQPIREISSTQTGYNDRIESFKSFISLLKTVPGYKPNEDELKVESLTAYCNLLDSTNNDVLTASNALDMARIARNKVLYTEKTGLCAVAADVKSYLKSVYGATGAEYKLTSGIKFKPFK